MIEGVGVLLLLSAFFAYVLAPVLPPIRKLVRVGHRRRPVSDATAILIVYAVLAVPGVFLWRSAAPAMKHWVAVTAPETVNHLFGAQTMAPLEHAIAHVPLPLGLRVTAVHGGMRVAGSLERAARSTLAEMIAAAPYAEWLALAPVLAFVVLAGAPVFQRSALRVLPRGHMQWRAEEYLRDVNSALAGYVRAQASAAVIVGAQCVVGFGLLGVPSAISLGVLAGILELVPAIGPVTLLLIATAQGTHVLPIVLFLGTLRLVQDYVIYPRLIRRGMHLSTPAVILTVWTGATLAGAAGALIAPLRQFWENLIDALQQRCGARLVAQPA